MRIKVGENRVAIRSNGVAESDVPSSFSFTSSVLKKNIGSGWSFIYRE